MNKELYLRWGIITFGLFLILSLTVSTGILTAFDYRTTIILQSFIPRFLDTPFSVFSILGMAEITAIILVIALFLFRKVKIIEVLLLFVVVGLIEIVGKTFINHPQPPIELLRTNIHFGFPTNAVHQVAEFFSYPSGHSARTAFISGFLIIITSLSPKLKISTKQIIIVGILVFDFLMFLSRVYLGEHWVTDVVGGALLGFSFAFFYFIFSDVKFF